MLTNSQTLQVCYTLVKAGKYDVYNQCRNRIHMDIGYQISEIFG